MNIVPILACTDRLSLLLLPFTTQKAFLISTRCVVWTYFSLCVGLKEIEHKPKEMKQEKFPLKIRSGYKRVCREDAQTSPAPRVQLVLVATGLTCRDGVASPGLAASPSTGICPSFWDVIFLSWKLLTNVLQHVVVWLWLPAREGISQHGRHRNLVEMAQLALWEVLVWQGTLC